MGVGRIGDGAVRPMLGDKRHGYRDSGGKSCWTGIAPLPLKKRGQAARYPCPGTYIPSQIAFIPFHPVSFRFISFHSVSLRCRSRHMRAHSDAVLSRAAEGRGNAPGTPVNATSRQTETFGQSCGALFIVLSPAGGETHPGGRDLWFPAAVPRRVGSEGWWAAAAVATAAGCCWIFIQ